MTISNSGSVAAITLEADISNFNANMAKASQQVDRAMREMQSSTGMVKTAMLGLQGVVSSVAVGGLVSLVKSAIDGMDALNDLADASSASVEKLSALEDVAARSGANFDTVSTAVLKFNKLLTDAKPGSEAEAGLKAFGLEAKKLKELDPADAMLMYAQAIAKFADDGNKARLVQEQTGKSVKEMAPFLKDLAEQHALVARVTTQQSQEAEKFNKELFNMQKNAQDVARAVGNTLLPVLNKVFSDFRTFGEKANLAGAAGDVLRLNNELKSLEASKARPFNFDANIDERIQAVTAKLAAAKEKFNQLDVDRPKPAGGGRGFVNPELVKPSVIVPDPDPKKTGGVLKDLDADYKAYMKSLEGQIQKTQELTATEKLLNEIRIGSLTVNSKQEGALTVLAAAIDREKEMVQTLKMQRDAVIGVGDAINKENEEYQRMAAQTTANVENIRIGLMDELGQEALAHELRLAELQKFHDLKLENVVQANALMEAENARHEQTKLELQTANQLSSLAMAGNSADSLYRMMEKSGREQSALGKGMFLASKAIAVAEIILNTEVAAAKAGAQLGIFGLPMATTIRVTGYASAGMVAGMAIADASAEGGYDIPAGTNPMTQLHEREMVLPKAQADVIRGLASDGGGGAPITWTIVNQTSAPIGRVTEQRISATERALIIHEAVGTVASQMGDPNSQTSRAFGRNFNAPRSR